MTLNKVGITVVLNRLARSDTQRARGLYGKLMGSWGHRPDRQKVTVKLGEQDIQCLDSLGLNGIVSRDVLPSPYWRVTYRHPRKPQLEVQVSTKAKPRKKRTFKIGGARRVLVAVAAYKVDSNKHKEAVRMATKTRKGKKAVEEDELDELEGLEELDDLDEEDLEEDEPDDEDEDDEEDEEPAPRKRSKAKAKAPAKSKTRRRKPEPEEDEDDEEEDEDEEPAPKRRSKAAPKSKASTKKTATKSKSNGKGNLPATRELPKGKVGPQDLADMVGGDCDARYVRIWLRDSEYEREDGSRWAFSKTEAKQIVREIKRDRKEHGAG